MKIYTKTGDSGDTGLYGGQRVSKCDGRVEAYGLIDETNAFLGVARACRLGESLDSVLQEIQGELFCLGAELSTPASHRDKLRMRFVGAESISLLETTIDRLEAALPDLKTFVLPAGCAGACALHTARTVCRRAERGVIAAREQAEVRSEVLIYLNRLSDLLFVMARTANQEAGQADVAWAPRAI